MPVRSKNDLPKGAMTVPPPKARKSYQSTYNDAHDQYGQKSKRRGDESRAEIAGKVAWSAVGKKYRKGDDGKWHSK